MVPHVRTCNYTVCTFSKLYDRFFLNFISVFFSLQKLRKSSSTSTAIASRPQSAASAIWEKIICRAIGPGAPLPLDNPSLPALQIIFSQIAEAVDWGRLAMAVLVLFDLRSFAKYLLLLVTLRYKVFTFHKLYDCSFLNFISVFFFFTETSQVK